MILTSIDINGTNFDTLVRLDSTDTLVDFSRPFYAYNLEVQGVRFIEF